MSPAVTSPARERSAGRSYSDVSRRSDTADGSAANTSRKATPWPAFPGVSATESGLEDESCDGNRSKASWRVTFRRGSCRLVYGRRGMERSSSDAADRAGACDGDAGCGHGDSEAPSVVAGDRAAL